MTTESSMAIECAMIKLEEIHAQGLRSWCRECYEPVPCSAMLVGSALRETQQALRAALVVLDGDFGFGSLGEQEADTLERWWSLAAQEDV